MSIDTLINLEDYNDQMKAWDFENNSSNDNSDYYLDQEEDFL